MRSSFQNQPTSFSPDGVGFVLPPSLVSPRHEKLSLKTKRADHEEQSIQLPLPLNGPYNSTIVLNLTACRNVFGGV